jgi:hypothetical protein
MFLNANILGKEVPTSGQMPTRLKIVAGEEQQDPGLTACLVCRAFVRSQSGRCDAGSFRWPMSLVIILDPCNVKAVPHSIHVQTQSKPEAVGQVMPTVQSWSRWLPEPGCNHNAQTNAKVGSWYLQIRTLQSRKSKNVVGTFLPLPLKKA